MSRAAVLIVLLAVTPAASARTVDPSRPPPGPESPAAAKISYAAPLEQQLLASINGVRRRAGLVELRPNRRLAIAARLHSASMAAHGFFGHGSYRGSAFGQRIKTYYPPVPGRRWSAGENMIWRSPGLSAATAIRVWLRTSPHRQNLLTPSWREVGIGAAHALAAPGVYRHRNVTIVTVDFGAR